jgi:hypothetical protein
MVNETGRRKSLTTDSLQTAKAMQFEYFVIKIDLCDVLSTFGYDSMQ